MNIVLAQGGIQVVRFDGCQGTSSRYCCHTLRIAAELAVGHKGSASPDLAQPWMAVGCKTLKVQLGNSQHRKGLYFSMP